MQSEAIRKLDEVFNKATPVAIRIDISWKIARELYNALLRSRAKYNSTIVEEQYSLNLLSIILMSSPTGSEVSESEKQN